MAFRHKGVGVDLYRSEWEAIDAHEFDGESAGKVLMLSVPPSGKCRILNIYYDPVENKAIFEYEDVPVP